MPAATLRRISMKGTKFYCLVNRGTLGVNNLPRVVARIVPRQESNPQPLDHESSATTTTPPSHMYAVQMYIGLSVYSAGKQFGGVRSTSCKTTWSHVDWTVTDWSPRNYPHSGRGIERRPIYPRHHPRQALLRTPHVQRPLLQIQDPRRQFGIMRRRCEVSQRLLLLKLLSTFHLSWLVLHSQTVRRNFRLVYQRREVRRRLLLLYNVSESPIQRLVLSIQKVHRSFNV